MLPDRNQGEFYFNPDLCRNESEVESKLIVQYLLPKLGYSPDTWHQEVTFGNIRLDFLAFASQVVPFVFDNNSPLSVVMEAKHPRENLNKHIYRLRRYLISLNVQYGLLTNGKEIRIYQKRQETLELVFQCYGKELEAKLDEIKALIGRDSLKETVNSISFLENKKIDEKISCQPDSNPITSNNKENSMKVIAVFHNKGGVGKTTTVVNLAAAIRKKGKRVLVIDIDSQANTTFATGLIKFDDEEFDNIKNSNIRHVLNSEDFYPISEVAKKSQFCNPEISVIPSHIELMEDENKFQKTDTSRFILIHKLEMVKNDYDVVLIDTPPSLDLFAKIALITADYLIVPSDLKPFANQGLINVKNLVKDVNFFKKVIGKTPLIILGVLPCKISTNPQFVKHTLPKRLKAISEKYGFDVLESIIYEREELAKCAEKTQKVGDLEIADPVSVQDFKPDSMSAEEFESLAIEVLKKIGIK